MNASSILLGDELLSCPRAMCFFQGAGEGGNTAPWRLWAPARPLLAVLSGEAEGSSTSESPTLPLMRQEALQVVPRGPWEDPPLRDGSW